MRKRYIFLGVILIMVAATVCIIIAFGCANSVRLADARSRVEIPPVVLLHEQIKGRPAEGSTSIEEPPTRFSDADILSARERIAVWEALLERVAAWKDALTNGELTRFLNGHSGDAAPPFPEEIVVDLRKAIDMGGPIAAIDFSAWPSEEAYDKLMRQDLGLTTSGILLVERGQRLMEEGNYEESTEDLLAVMDLADIVGALPVEFWLGSRYILSKNLQAGLWNISLPEKQVEIIFRRLAESDGREFAWAALEGEFHRHLVEYEHWRQVDLKDAVDRGGFVWGARSWLWSQPVCKPWFDSDEMQFVERAQRLLELPQRPYFELSPQIEEIEDERASSWKAQFPAQFRIEEMTRILDEQAQHEAWLDIMQIGLVLEQYYAKQGSYPETLAAIADKFGGKLPVDPFTGDQYRYESNGGRLVVYSNNLRARDEHALWYLHKGIVPPANAVSKE